MQKITMCMGNGKAEGIWQCMHVHRVMMACKLVNKFPRSSMKYKNAQKKECQYFM
jgi:hypothetical protein